MVSLGARRNLPNDLARRGLVCRRVAALSGAGLAFCERTVHVAADKRSAGERP